MSHLDYSESSYRSPVHGRILANMPVRASWVDSESGEKIVVDGLTENVGENSTLVNLDVLPPVGSEVKLRILEGEDSKQSIIEVQTEVIRVERDPSKPLAALSVVQNLKKWKQVALTAAENWVTRHWQLNYEEEWIN
jgi:hypothetical protein